MVVELAPADRLVLAENLHGRAEVKSEVDVQVLVCRGPGRGEVEIDHDAGLAKVAQAEGQAREGHVQRLVVRGEPCELVVQVEPRVVDLERGLRRLTARQHGQRDLERVLAEHIGAAAKGEAARVVRARAVLGRVLGDAEEEEEEGEEEEIGKERESNGKGGSKGESERKRECVCVRERGGYQRRKGKERQGGGGGRGGGGGGGGGSF